VNARGRKRQLSRQNLVTEPESGRMTLIAVTLLVIGATVPYLTAVGGQFVIDDAPLVVNGASLSEGGSISAALTQPSFGRAVYRPLWRVGFAVQRELFDLDPRGYHVVSILLHALCSVLLFFLLLRLLEENSTLPAFLGALMFSVHPVHVEAVAWISAVGHVQATALCLLALLGYLEWRKKPRWMLLIGSILCAACAVLFQEIAVVLPILIIMLDFGRSRRPKMEPWLAFLAVAASYLVIRRAVLGAALPFRVESVDSALRIPEFAVAYVKSVLVPFPQFMFLNVVPAGFIGRWSYLLAAAAVVACLSLMVSRARNRAMAIQGVLWFVISMLPPLYAAFHGEAVFALRLLYLPSIAVAIVVAWAAASGGSTWRRSMTTAVVLLSVVGGVATASANHGWLNDEVVYLRIIEFAPSDLDAHNALALYYRDHPPLQGPATSRGFCRDRCRLRRGWKPGREPGGIPAGPRYRRPARRRVARTRQSRVPRGPIPRCDIQVQRCAGEGPRQLRSVRQPGSGLSTNRRHATRSGLRTKGEKHQPGVTPHASLHDGTDADFSFDSGFTRPSPRRR
jgi:hypothetical protein